MFAQYHITSKTDFKVQANGTHMGPTVPIGEDFDSVHHCPELCKENINPSGLAKL